VPIGLSRRSLPLAVPPHCQPVDRAHVSGAGPIDERLVGLV